MHSIFRALFINLGLIYGMGMQMLVLPTSADQLSLGSHPTLAGLFPLNPALINANEKHPYLSLNRGNWLGDISMSQIGYNNIIMGNKAHFGMRYLGISDLEFRDNVPTDKPASLFSAFGITVDASTALQYQNHRIGVNVSYIQFNIFNENAQGLSFDIGYALNLKNNYVLGLTIKDFGIMSRLNNENPSLPMRISCGASKKMEFKQYSNSAYGSIEWNSISSNTKIYFGNHFQLNQINLMFGYAASENVSETSAGLGFNFNTYTITYGTRFGTQDVGVPKLLSLNILLP